MFRDHLTSARAALVARDAHAAVTHLMAAMERIPALPSKALWRKAKRIVHRAIVLTRAATLVRSIQDG